MKCPTKSGICDAPVIASEAKQSSGAAAQSLDCFVATLLAMTMEPAGE
jgi:hypothetical protein